MPLEADNCLWNSLVLLIVHSVTFSTFPPEHSVTWEKSKHQVCQRFTSMPLCALLSRGSNSCLNGPFKGLALHSQTHTQTKELLSAAFAHQKRTETRLVGLISCRSHWVPPSTNNWNVLKFVNTFWRPGNLNFALLRASMTCSLFWVLVRTDMITWPMCTRATVPWGFPKAPRIPVWSLEGKAGNQSSMTPHKIHKSTNTISFSVGHFHLGIRKS